MGGPNDTKEDHGSSEPKQHHPEHSEGGNSGHGAASAMAHMISQGRDRRQTGDADAAAGAQGQ